MASYYVIKAGKRIYRETKAEIRKVAEMVANQVGHAVQVYSDVTGTDYGAGMKSHAVKMTRNPVKKRAPIHVNNLLQTDQIYHNGFLAKSRGEPSTANPYPKGSPRRASWRLGYQMGPNPKYVR